MGDALIRALVGRSLTLPHELTDKFPELDAVKWREGGLPVRIAGWCLGQRSAAAITLWRTVFLAPALEPDAELLLHELRHVHQFEERLTFPLQYIWESLRRGYYQNRFEADARAYAARRVRDSV